jgi:hypothetical protein
MTEANQTEAGRSAVKIDASFKWRIGRRDFRTPGAWAKVRVMKDPRRGDEYCDVLIGVFRDEPHIHIGINRDASIRFQEGRGRLHTINRLVEDSNWGVVDTGGVAYKPTPGDYQFTIKLRVSEPLRTVWVDFGETELKSRK